MALAPKLFRRLGLVLLGAASLSSAVALAQSAPPARDGFERAPRGPVGAVGAPYARYTTAPTVVVTTAGPATGVIDDRYAADLDNGCEYRSTVRGTVRPEGSALAPDLRVRASVHCPNVPRVSAPERAVRARANSPEQLARAVAAAGRVHTRGADGACQYVPAFRAAGTQLAARDVSYTCLPARGGGPTAGGVYHPPATPGSRER
jgi:hypothetical protein